MAITKEVVIDQTTVVENGTVHYRETTKIIEDGVEITKKYHRFTLIPGQDLTGAPANVAAICNVAWTPEVIAAYQAQQEANRPAPAATPEPTPTPTQEPAAP